MALSGTGFLKRVTDKIRKFANDPTISKRFSDAELLDYIRTAWAEVLDEVNRMSTQKLKARINVTIIAGQADYVLPPTIGQFLLFEKIEAVTGRPEWEVIPNHPLAPYGPNFSIEGPVLHLDPLWQSGYTMRITYVPNAEATLFEASAIAWDTTNGDDITIPATITDGSVDTRAKAYCGYVLRVLGASQSGKDFIQERVVTDYDNENLKLIFTPALSPIPTEGTVTFEVVPAHAFRYEDAIALKVARRLCLAIRDRNHAEDLRVEYQDVMRSLRLGHAQTEGRTGQKFQRAVRGRRNVRGRM
jgi:hypothetical protein